MKLSPALTAVLIGLLLSLASSSRALAHALLARSLPAADAVLSEAPTKIELWFTEALEPDFSRVRLFDSNSQEVSIGVASLDPSDETHLTLALDPLEPGVYTVAWQNLSKADGHELSGSFPFTVLNPDGTRPGSRTEAEGGPAGGNLPPPGLLLARWFLLLGGSLMFGAALFQSVVVPVRLVDDQHDTAPVEMASLNLVVIAIWASAVAITLGQGLHLIFHSIDLGGLVRLPDLLLGTRAGSLLLGRQTVALTILLVSLKLPQPWLVSKRMWKVGFAVALPVMLLIGLLVLSAAQGQVLQTIPSIGIAFLGLVIWTQGDVPPAAWRKQWIFLVVLSGVFLLGISLGSHASAGSGSFLAVLADFIHLVAAGAWVGGLLMIAGLLWWYRHLPTMDYSNSHRPFLILIRRFSFLASLCVFILFLTGLFNSMVQLPQFPLLWTTTYGQVLLLKLGLILSAMSVAFLNNRLIQRGGNHENSNTLLRLSRRVALEVGVVLLLMISVAALVQTPTPRDAALAGPGQEPAPHFEVFEKADDLSLHILINPNQVGNNRFLVHVFHADSSPVGEIQLVQLRFNYREQLLGETKVDLVPSGGGAFTIEGAFLSQAGKWDLTAYIRRRGQDDALAKFNLDVSPPGVTPIPSTPWQNPVPAIPPAVLAICLVLTITAFPIVWHKLRQKE